MNPILLLKNLSNYFRRASLKPMNIMVSVGIQLIFGFIINPIMEKRVDPNDKYPILDLRFGFNLNQAYDTLTNYGLVGRENYLLLAGFIDMLYPIVYCIAFALTMSMFFQKAFSTHYFLQYFNIFPFVIAIGDYFENTGIVIMLLNFPEKIHWACQLASDANLFKWGSFLFNLLLMMTGMIAWGLKTIFIKNKKY